MSDEDPSAVNCLPAVRAYSKGGLELFPASPRDKTPLVSQFRATSDLGVLTGWWERWPGALIGCRVGIDVMVIDVDPRHGGDRTWDALEEEYGPIRVGREHFSGRGDGGFHAWFDRPQELTRVTAKRLHQWAREHETGSPVLDKITGRPVLLSDGRPKWVCGLDLLTHEYRYTILPPSPHPDTGKPYRWRERNGVLVPPPPPLVELITPEAGEPDDHEEEEEEEEQAGGRDRIRLHDLEHGDSIADWFCAEWTWRRILEPHGWKLVHGKGDADGSLWRHPDATSDHSASIKYGCLFVYSPNTAFDQSEESEPHGYTRFAAWAVLEHGGDQSAAAGAARALKTGLAPAVKPVEVDRPPGGLVTLADLLTSQDEEYDWLIPGLIERGDRFVLTGEEGQGKSTLLRQIGLAVSAGLHPFTNQAMRPLRVLLVDCENSLRQMRREFRMALAVVALAGHKDEATGRFYVEARTEGLVLDAAKDPDGDRVWLEEAIAKAEPELVILGPVYKLIEGDPTEEMPNRELVRFIDRLRGRYGFAVMLESHTPHDRQRPYGWSGWKRWPEFGLHLDQLGVITRWRGDRDERQWPEQLRRGGRGEWPWMPGVPTGGGPAPTPADKQYAEVKVEVVKVLRAAKKPLDRDAIVERTGRARSLVLKALREFQDNGGLLVTHGPPGASGKPPELFQIDPHGYLAPTP